MIGENAVLPPGPYIFEVFGLQGIRKTISHDQAACFYMKLMGYDYTTFWWLSQLYDQYRDIVSDWSLEGLQSIVGTAFLFDVKLGTYNGHSRNLLGMPLAVVVSEPF